MKEFLLNTWRDFSGSLALLFGLIGALLIIGLVLSLIVVSGIVLYQMVIAMTWNMLIFVTIAFGAVFLIGFLIFNIEPFVEWGFYQFDKARNKKT